MKLVKVVLSILVALVYCSASEKIDVSITAVGNPGVGKSFLLNLLINIRNHFAHETRPDRVTEKIEPFVTTVSFGDSESKVSVINIPGILDLQPELLVQNKQKFDDAMKANDQQVFVYILVDSFPVYDTSVVFIGDSVRDWQRGWSPSHGRLVHLQGSPESLPVQTRITDVCL